MMKLLLLIFLIAKASADCQEQFAFSSGADNQDISMICLQNTNGTIGNWTEIDDTFDPFYLWDSTAPGHTAYLGSDFIFNAIHVQIVSNFSDSSKIAIEYWNGNTWVSTSTMSFLAVTPYYTYANKIFERIQCNEVVVGLTTGWSLLTLNGVTKYWLRFRITSAIATIPQLAQLTRAYDEFEVDAGGYTHYTHGVVGHVVINFDSTAGNANTYIGDFPIFGFKFANSGSTDASATASLPRDIDTSKPIKLTLSWHSAGTGNLQWTIKAVKSNTGGGVFATQQTAPSYQFTYNTVITNIPNTEMRTTVLIPIDNMSHRSETGLPDVLLIGIHRNAGLASDTLNNYVTVHAATISYIKVAEGVHPSLYLTVE